MTIQISGSMGRMDNYIRAIWKAGGQVRAGYCPEPDLTCDGLLLAGGGDIAPERYGQGMEGSLPPDPLRDEAELALFRAFYGAGKPILGICRGHQLINVALGGTLIQDLPPGTEGVPRRSGGRPGPPHPDGAGDPSGRAVRPAIFGEQLPPPGC